MQRFRDLILIVLVINAFTLPDGSFIKQYTVDDDEDQLTAYKRIYTDYQDAFEEYMNKFIRNNKSSQMQSTILDYSKKIINKLDKNSISYKRIKIFSDVSGYSMEEIYAFSTTYEYACTSVLFKTNNKGIIMGRNLDFGPIHGRSSTLFNKSGYQIDYYLSGLSYQVSHTKNKKVYLIGVGGFGFVGYLNGISPSKFTFSLNQKNSYLTTYDKFSSLLNGDKEPLLHLLESVYDAAINGDYADLKKALISKGTTFADYCYYVIGGNKSDEGVIITRELNSSTLTEIGSNDYLVQTNNDQIICDKTYYYKESEVRQCTANKRLKENSNKLANSDDNLTALLENIMGVSPNFIHVPGFSTIYTSVQSHQDSVILTYKYVIGFHIYFGVQILVPALMLLALVISIIYYIFFYKKKQTKLEAHEPLNELDSTVNQLQSNSAMDQLKAIIQGKSTDHLINSEDFRNFTINLIVCSQQIILIIALSSLYTIINFFIYLINDEWYFKLSVSIITFLSYLIPFSLYFLNQKNLHWKIKIILIIMSVLSLLIIIGMGVKGYYDVITWGEIDRLVFRIVTVLFLNFVGLILSIIMLTSYNYSIDEDHSNKRTLKVQIRKGCFALFRGNMESEELEIEYQNKLLLL